MELGYPHNECSHLEFVYNLPHSPPCLQLMNEQGVYR
uniref:Uncharacterized protein n=1 Tax=Nelumbo nucifera TaxID=4432 RepID=A0A822XYY3_NELNU|nr:TPA_asm: hypothetical protein HUJ06_025458 [Nelumbo nucifera]